MLDVALALIVGLFEGRADRVLTHTMTVNVLLSDHHVVAAGCKIHESWRLRRLRVH